jgi:hypothetical protein
MPAVEGDRRILFVTCLKAQDVRVVRGSVVHESTDQSICYAGTAVRGLDIEPFQFTDIAILELKSGHADKPACHARSNQMHLGMFQLFYGVTEGLVRGIAAVGQLRGQRAQ